MVQSWQLEQLEEPEQDLMDKSGLRTASSSEDLNVRAACWFAAAAAINGSYTACLNQIGAITLEKFPICCRS